MDNVFAKPIRRPQNFFMNRNKSLPPKPAARTAAAAFLPAGCGSAVENPQTDGGEIIPQP